MTKSVAPRMYAVGKSKPRSKNTTAVAAPCLRLCLMPNQCMYRPLWLTSSMSWFTKSTYQCLMKSNANARKIVLCILCYLMFKFTLQPILVLGEVLLCSASWLKAFPCNAFVYMLVPHFLAPCPKSHLSLAHVASFPWICATGFTQPRCIA